MIHAPKFGGIYLLGDEEKDIELLSHLMQEVDLMIQLRSEGGELEVMELDKCIEWKLVALLQRCYAMLSEYDSQKTALAINPIVEAKSKSDAYSNCSAVSKDVMDKLIRRDAVKLRRRADGVLRGQAAPAAEEPKATPQEKKAPETAMPPPAKMLSESEVISKLAEFYSKVNPNFQLPKIKKIWSDNKHDPQDMYSRMVSKYGEKDTACVSFLAKHPKTETMSKESVKKPAKTASAAAATPRKGPGVVGGILGVIASPVARLFGGEQEEELPQAILPSGNDARWDEAEGRWIFPDDEEGEAERQAIADACKGPPPPPPSGGTGPPAGGSCAQYVDPFNSAGSTTAAPMALPVAPPMPPMPGMMSALNDENGDDNEDSHPSPDSEDVVQ